MKLLRYIYEEFKDCFEKTKDDAELFGFWQAIRHDIDGVFYKYIWWYVKKIVKIIKWIPVIWHDEDWDHTYILKLLKYKFERVKDEIRRGHGDVEQWVSPRITEIDSAIKCIDNILDGEFTKQEMEEHESKYGRIQFDSKPTENERLTQMIFYYDKIQRDTELQEIAREEGYKIHTLEEERMQQEINKLFKILADNIQKWWD